MKTLDESFRDWEASAFGFGYGSGEEHVIPTLRQFFELTPPQDADSRTYDYAVLEAELGPAVAWFIINLMGRDGMIEYGTSPRYAWLTEKGYALRTYMLSKTVDELLDVLNYDQDYAVCYPTACNCGPSGYEEGKVCANPFWGTA